MNPIHIGEKVQWICKPNNKKVKPFNCKGIIKNVKTSTFGGSQRSKGASIEVSTKKYHELFGKKIAFVRLDKLTLLD